MEIIILGKKVETKEIFDIRDVEYKKEMFLNRDAGFIIYLIDKEPLIFSERIPYESYPSEIAYTKAKWKGIQNEVYNEWQKDKTGLTTINE